MALEPPYRRDARERLRELVRSWASSVAPGALELLTVYTAFRYGKDFINLFLEAPCEALQVLGEVYGDVAGASLNALVRTLFKPLLESGPQDPSGLPDEALAPYRKELVECLRAAERRPQLST